MPLCPSCSSSDIVKNGRIHNGKQRFKCQECGRQFVEHSQKKVIGSATRELIDRLLLERISRFGHCSCCAGFRGMVATLREREICLCAAPSAGKPQKKGRRERFNATSYGHSWTIRRTNSGFGSRSMQTHVKSLAFTLGHGTKPQPANCGIPCLRYIVNARLLTLIFGQPTERFYRASGIVQSERKLAKPVTLNDSTTP